MAFDKADEERLEEIAEGEAVGAVNRTVISSETRNLLFSFPPGYAERAISAA